MPKRPDPCRSQRGARIVTADERWPAYGKHGPRRRNSYPGTCAQCGHPVPAGAGIVTRGLAGGWDVICADPL